MFRIDRKEVILTTHQEQEEHRYQEEELPEAAKTLEVVCQAAAYREEGTEAGKEVSHLEGTAAHPEATNPGVAANQQMVTEACSGIQAGVAYCSMAWLDGTEEDE